MKKYIFVLLFLLPVFHSFSQTPAFHYSFVFRVDYSIMLRSYAGHHTQNPVFINAFQEADSLYKLSGNDSLSLVQLFASIYHRNTKKSLHTILEILPSTADSTIINSMERQHQQQVAEVSEIMKRRLFLFYGGGGYTVEVLGKSGKIRVEARDYSFKDHLRFLLTNNGALVFTEVLDRYSTGQLIQKIDSACIKNKIGIAGISEGKPQTLFIKALGMQQTQGITYQSRYRKSLDSLLNIPKISAVYSPSFEFYWTNHTKNESFGDSDDLVFCYGAYYEGTYRMAAPKIDTAYISKSNYDPSVNELNFTFAGKDVSRWAWFTERASQSRSAIAMVVGDYCFSTPVVHSKIPTGQCVVSGMFDETQMKVLAALIRCDPYPCAVKLLEEKTITQK